MSRTIFAEVNENEAIVRIFKNEKDARLSAAWYQQRVWEVTKEEAVGAIRHAVFSRAENECERCGEFITRKSMHMDEKVSRGEGGEISLENCQALCAGCHILRPDSEHGDRRPQFVKDRNVNNEAN